MKRVISTILCLFVLLSFGIISTGFTNIPVKSLDTAYSKVTLRVGVSHQLNVTVSPSNASNKKLAYTSGNKQVATVDSKGKITPVKAGTATITISSAADKKITKKFIVTVTSKDLVFTIMRGSFPNAPFNANSPVINELYKRLKVKVKIQEVPYGEQTQKIQAAILANALPDAFWSETGDLNFLTKYARSGVYLPISDYIYIMPDFKKWVDANPDIYKYAINRKLYIFSNMQDKGLKQQPWPLIRKDILDSLNLPVPKTWDELYNTLKSMKQAYPDSTPWGVRFTTGMNNFKNFYAYALGSGLANGNYAGKGMYYDKDVSGGKWQYGAIHPQFKQALAFYSKLWAEKLISTDELNNQQWMDLYYTGKSFFFYDNTGYMNDVKLSESIPKAKMAAVPALKTSTNLQRSLNYGVQYSRGYFINANVKEPEAVCMFMNYLYSKEGAELTNYGILGQHYTKVDGKIALTKQTLDKYAKEQTPAYAFSAASGTGMQQLATVTTLPTNFWGNADMRARDIQIGAMVGNTDPSHNPPFTLWEEDRLAQLTDNAFNYVWPKIVEIINGTTQISEWDNIVAETKKLGAEEIEKIWNDAEARLK